MFKKILFSLTFCLPVVAQAEWTQLSSSDEYVTYIDPVRTKATQQSLKYAETWVKMVIHTDLTKDGLSVEDYKLAKYKIKCESNEIGLAAYYEYKKSGKLNYSEVPSYITYEPAIPESRGENMAVVVCQYLYGDEQSS